MSFTFVPSDLFPEVIKIFGQRFNDERGYFCESFKQKEFLDNGLPEFVQENHSFSKPSTIRGLHYQVNPKAQGKLVYCVSGDIFDFVVDIRKNSPTYKEWFQYHLSGDDQTQLRMLYIPPGFAHGFRVFGIYNAHVVYKVTEYYSPDHEKSIRWNDPDLKIMWGESHPRMSDRDRNAPLLKDAENNF
jgi:dTDP-4-dehydrorhamnose 3,5-epimerase